MHALDWLKWLKAWSHRPDNKNENDNENDNDNDKNARARLIEMLHAEYAHAHSTNQGCAFVSFSFMFFGPSQEGHESTINFD